jgi:hypothetical protein
MDIADAYAYASEVMVENMMMADAAEGIGAFIEKRKPGWRTNNEDDPAADECLSADLLRRRIGPDA